MTLKDLAINRTAEIRTVGGNGELRQHFLDMGLIPGEKVTMVKHAPMGDPVEVQIQGYELTLRLADAEQIIIEENCTIQEKSQPAETESPKTDALKNPEHPGLGEGGRYHSKDHENPVPEGTKLTFALVGNQNCGKTTLFNQLTGSNQHVGNFPGVTVDKKSGQIKNNPNTEITDLPGIYSLSPYTNEEIVTRSFILDEKPLGIINIVDANNIERNLYLTLQLMNLEVPMVLALNMMDEVHKNGGSILINKLENELGIPVVPISASRNEGVDELLNHALHVAKFQEKPARNDFCDAAGKSAAVHRALHGIVHLIQDHAEKHGIPARFAATKIIEGDPELTKLLELDDNEKEMIEHVIIQMEQEGGLDRAAAIADMRYSFIKKIVAKTVVKPKESVEHKRSEKIDRILTGKYTAIPCFVLIMAAIFFLTFNVIGLGLQTLLENGIDALTQVTDAGLAKLNLNPTVHSLVIDGIFSGVGSVLSFLPIIITLFFFLSLLEDTGYMARIAFIMDKLLRKLGLSGRSIVPLLIGFGCSVPGIMASRTMPSERDRKMTVLLTPFMSCSAKLPVYAFFCSAFFGKYAGLAMVLLYFTGIIAGILCALLYRKTMFKGEAVPFVMELPNYRLPGAKTTLHLLWEKAKDFLEKAFTIIFLATIIIWFLQTFDLHFQVVADSKDSILAMLSSLIAPVFKPLGFGDWRISTSLISGFVAKESVVSTLNILFSGAELTQVLNLGNVIPLLVFCLLYTPCVAAIAAVKRELGRLWALYMVAGQCTIAWIFAFAARLICSAAGL
ncbi:MAG: ferrous iron transport protein B [Treponemataceae bacterium]|nr:ferrous iron transport protein B [Treponemataceae bacterium]